jgi:ribosomal protein S21
MIHIKKRKEGESNESLIGKFRRDTRSSGMVNTVKSHQTFERKLSRNRKRTNAQRRRVTREQREHDIKTGKLVIVNTYRKN